MTHANSPTTQVVVVGAGPAGLATSAELRRRGVRHRVLEQGDGPGHTWTRLYDSLTLHTGKHLSALPGLPFERAVPLFPTRQHFVDYLDRYVRRFDVPVETGVAVRRVSRAGDRWRVETTAGDVVAGAVVAATGIISSPRLPAIEGRERFRGRVMHSVEYRRPAEFVGRRVLVVGVGNSGAEIASELARAGAKVTVAVRSGANVVPLTLLGVPIQYLALPVRRLPRPARERVARAVAALGELRRGKPVLPRPAHGPLDAIPLIGFHLVDAIRDGLVEVRGALDGFTERGVRFAAGDEEEYDDVILATGFTAAVGPWRDVVRLDARGFAVRRDRVASADHANLYFVGHNYDSAGGLYNIARDARLVAERIAAAGAASR